MVTPSKLPNWLRERIIATSGYPGQDHTPYLCFRERFYRSQDGNSRPERRLVLVIDHWSPAARNWTRIGSGAYQYHAEIPGSESGNPWLKGNLHPKDTALKLIDLGFQQVTSAGNVAAGLYLGRCEHHDGKRQWRLMPQVVGNPKQTWLPIEHDTALAWLPLPGIGK
ncbi:MAG: hypothetical protein ACFB0C_03735 [Leptolyngbyaceae cyanobacterium]